MVKSAANTTVDAFGQIGFDPTIEWDGFATDTFGGLGTHDDACGPVPSAPSSWGSLKSLYR